MKISILNELPVCGSYKDEWNGDWDCEYYPVFECEECVLNKGKWKGLDPRTDVKFKIFRRFWRKDETYT